MSNLLKASIRSGRMNGRIRKFGKDFILTVIQNEQSLQSVKPQERTHQSHDSIQNAKYEDTSNFNALSEPAAEDILMWRTRLAGLRGFIPSLHSKPFALVATICAPKCLQKLL